MSSPISSLKKGKRTPLDPRQAQVPFRQPAHTPNDPLDEIPSAFLRKDVQSRLPKSSSSTNDSTLLSSMMSRLAQAEQQLKAAQGQLLEKDKKIRILEEKAKLLEKARGYNSGTITELEKKCRSLQSQVFQMEDFLADYGMVWVGDDAVDFSKYKALEEESPDPVAQSAGTQTGIWKPDSSVVSSTEREFRMDFDLVLKNIRELNILAGEGCSVVSRTKDGARLKVPDSVPLTLYENGILMFAGPFRPYSDPSTQHCMQDLMDGFFPSELQTRYPEGVPIEVQDKRDVVFEDRRTALLFPGAGQTLIDEEHEHENPKKVESASSAINKKQSMDQFLARLPQSVIKDGKIIDVRSGIADVIKGGEGQSDVKVLDTPALQEIKSRSGNSHSRPQSGSAQVTTLRIKSETGEMTFILKMKFTDSIQDVRNHIDTARPKDASPYEIKTSFPNKVYNNSMATLQECGLVPNATLHLLTKKT